MDTTRLLRLALALFILHGVSGCTGGSPDSVVENFYDAIFDQDFNRAKRYCTESFGNMYVTSLESAMSMIPEDITDDPAIENPYSRENLESTVQGDTARVWHRDVPYMVIVLKKEGMSWKISSFDMDYSALGDMFQDIGAGDLPF